MDTRGISNIRKQIKMKPGPVVVFVTLLVIGLADVRAGEFQSAAAMRIITPDPFLPVSGGAGEPDSVTE